MIINGRNYPTYAIEENFGKRLIENNQRRDAPIFKLFERENIDRPFVFNISFYQRNRWMSNDSGISQLRRVERLINGFANGELNPSEVFDLDLFAKTYAIGDLFGYHHSLAIANMRYYLNPITGLIEPIPYDNQLISQISKDGLVGEQYLHFGNNNLSDTLDESQKGRIQKDFVGGLFTDYEFTKKNIIYLKKYSSKEWLDDFFNKISKKEEKALSLIHRSFHGISSHTKAPSTIIKNILDLFLILKGFKSFLSRKSNSHIDIMVCK